MGDFCPETPRNLGLNTRRCLLSKAQATYAQRMKTLFLLAFVTSSGFALAESVVPAPYERSRYDETLARSPFVLATPPEAPKEEEKDSPLSNLYITGMGKLDNGRDYVFVQRIGEERAMKFEGDQANEEGIAVKQVKWGDRWDKSTAVLSYKTEQKEVKFKENAGASQAPPVPPPNQGNPRQAGMVPNAPPPMMQTPAGQAPTTLTGRQGGSNRGPSSATGIPRPTTGAVPRPGSGATLAPPNSFRGGTLNPASTQGGNAPNTGAPRQRIRTINNR